MRTTLCFSWLVMGAILFPAVHAGSAASPELTDPAGDAPAHVDVLAAWWSSPNPSSVAVTLRLSDILVGQPLADSNLEENRWYYTLSFSTSAHTEPLTVRCIVGSVESSPIRGATITGDVGAVAGTECVASRVAAFSNRFAFNVNTAVDKLANTLTITMAETANPTVVDIGAGTSFTGLTVETAGGKVTNIGVNHKDKIYDTTGVGADFTM